MSIIHLACRHIYFCIRILHFYIYTTFTWVCWSPWSHFATGRNEKSSAPNDSGTALQCFFSARKLRSARKQGLCCTSCEQLPIFFWIELVSEVHLKFKSMGKLKPEKTHTAVWTIFAHFRRNSECLGLHYVFFNIALYRIPFLWNWHLFKLWQRQVLRKVVVADVGVFGCPSCIGKLENHGECRRPGHSASRII